MKNILIFLSLLITVCEAVNAQPVTGTESTRRRMTAAGVDTARRRPVPPPIGTITPTRETPVHDPVMVEQAGKYYLFCTGNGISVFSSKDMKNWRREAQVFSSTPQWVTKALPGFRGSSMWAPDISYHDGKYYLYYLVSVILGL
jgi:beta-xylosidase